MREQVELRYTIGFDKTEPMRKVRACTAYVREAACRFAGGCTLQYASGYWKSDGAKRQSQFFGETTEERSIIVSFSVELEKLDQTLHMMQKRLSQYILRSEINVEWVHVQQVATIGHHFNAKEYDNVAV